MSSDIDDDYYLRLHHAVQYLRKEHGPDAISEVKAALRYAEKINDPDTVDLYTQVLKQLED